MTQTLWRQALALVCVARGEHLSAEALAREAVGLIERTDALNMQGAALRDLAEVLAAAGRTDEAVEALEQALDATSARRTWPWSPRSAEAGGAPRGASRIAHGRIARSLGRNELRHRGVCALRNWPLGNTGAPTLRSPGDDAEPPVPLRCKNGSMCGRRVRTFDLGIESLLAQSRVRRMALASSSCDTDPSNFALIRPSAPTRNTHGSVEGAIALPSD